MSGDTCNAYAAFGPSLDLKPWSLPLHALGDDDVEVKIVFCGICHSDIHFITGEWGTQKWPVVPGHEIIGYVTKLGKNVSQFKMGQRVGVGPQAFCCGTCTQCKAGSEPYCLKGFGGTYGSSLPDGYVTQGGYAQYQRANQHFVFDIPEALPSADAAPLLCAGVTCFSPLKYANVGPGKKVGVNGIGGLGHLGIKLAAALGAEVYALSTSPSKLDEALKFGAKGLIDTKNKDDLAAHAKSFDMILNTASAVVDMGDLLGLVKSHGNLSTVGLPETPMKVPTQDFLRHITFTGTLVGSPSQTREMLELCAKNNITAQIEVFPLDRVNEALVRVNKNLARYRIVLEVDEVLDKKNRKAH